MSTVESNSPNECGHTQHLFARFGTFALTLRSPQGNLDSLRSSLKSQLLDKDSRVRAIEERDANRPPRVARYRFFHPYSHPDHDTLATNRDLESIVEFDPPLVMKIEAPKKNQPIPRDVGGSEPPAEEYWVVWNGFNAIVTWSQKHHVAPGAGGHLIEPILREAAESLGCELTVQSCHKSCSSMFIHTTVSLFERDSREKSTFERHSELRHVAHGPAFTDPRSCAIELSYTLLRPLRRFAVMKNMGSRILVVEDAARGELNNATMSQYHISRPENGRTPRAMVRNSLSRRNARKIIRESTAAASHFISVIELFRRQWEDEKSEFDQLPEDVRDLFLRDFHSDNSRVSGLDLERLESRATHVSEVQSNWSMAKVTLWGAIAGGFAGGVLGAIASFLSG